MSVNPRRIAVFQALNLGDFLCTTPALRALRHAFPTAEIAFIGRPWAKALIDRAQAVDRFLPFPGFPGIAESPTEDPPAPPKPRHVGVIPSAARTPENHLGSGQAPSSERRDASFVGMTRFGPAACAGEWPPFDLAIQMHGSGEVSNGFVATLGAEHTIGYGPSADYRLSQTLAWIADEPEPLRWLRLVAAIGAPAMGVSLDCPVTQDEHARASVLIGTPIAQPVIGLHVGSSLPDRRWPAASFARLGDALADRFGARIVLTGSAQEQPLTAQVRRAMRHPLVDLAGETGLGEFAAVITTFDLLVTNDTGASHVAAATRTRSVVLYGPSRPERWAPLDQELHRRIDAAAIVPARNGAAALRGLSVERVLAECVALLHHTGPKADVVTEERIAWAG